MVVDVLLLKRSLLRKMFLVLDGKTTSFDPSLLVLLLGVKRDLFFRKRSRKLVLFFVVVEVLAVVLSDEPTPVLEH